jgi:hypothetical protein
MWEIWTAISRTLCFLVDENQRHSAARVSARPGRGEQQFGHRQRVCVANSFMVPSAAGILARAETVARGTAPFLRSGQVTPPLVLDGRVLQPH